LKRKEVEGVKGKDGGEASLLRGKGGGNPKPRKKRMQSVARRPKRGTAKATPEALRKSERAKLRIKGGKEGILGGGVAGDMDWTTKKPKQKEQ